jgi:uncharacterized membrane protein
MWRRIAPADRDATAQDAPPHPSRAPLRGLVALAVVALPLIAWLARLGGWPAAGNVLSLALVAAAVAALVRGAGAAGALAILAGAALLAGAASALHVPPVFWPPVAINLVVAAVFGLSLRRGREPLVLRFARGQGAVVDDDVRAYCRRVTLAWVLWLAALGAAGAAIAIAGDERLGAAWSGGIDYALVAALFVGELAWRRASGRSAGGIAAQVRSVRTVLRERSE